MKISNKKIDKIIDLFAFYLDEKEGISLYGCDSELFENRKDARKAVKKIVDD